jgi:acid stress chaperone HdeB
MHTKCIVSGLILALAFASSGQAQVSLDISKITCAQFVHSEIAPPRTLAAWLSGYYNGARNNQTINPKQFEANLSKLTHFCYQEKNFKLPVMQAVETVLGK